MKEKNKNIPSLRFKEFNGEWKEEKISYLLKKIGEPVTPQPEALYREIGIRSHTKGIFHKDFCTGKSLGNKRVFEIHVPAFVVNIVFAWEHAIALTTEKEKGFIASHRFPMFIPKEKVSDLPFVKYFFTRKYGKHLLGLASPGGAGRNKTLGQKDFLDLKVIFPKKNEQEKISSFLSVVDTSIEQLTKEKILLEQYKKGMMQKLFSQKIRFKDDEGNDFPDWKEKRLESLFKWVRTNSLSREYLTHENTSSVQNIHYGDIHTKFNANFKQSIESAPYLTKSVDIAKFSENDFCQIGDVVIADASEDYADIGKAIEITEVKKNSLVAGLHTFIARPKKNNTVALGFFSYMLHSTDVRKQIMRLAQGISVLGISKKYMEQVKILMPCYKEQKKIISFFSSLDEQINHINQELQKAQNFKKGLLQKMFV